MYIFVYIFILKSTSVFMYIFESKFIFLSICTFLHIFVSKLNFFKSVYSCTYLCTILLEKCFSHKVSVYSCTFTLFQFSNLLLQLFNCCFRGDFCRNFCEPCFMKLASFLYTVYICEIGYLTYQLIMIRILIILKNKITSI